MKKPTSSNTVKKHTKSITLTETEVDNVIHETGIDEVSWPEVRIKIRKLTFQPHWKDCFDQSKSRNLYEQAVTKVYCWNKYGTDII